MFQHNHIITTQFVLLSFYNLFFKKFNEGYINKAHSLRLHPFHSTSISLVNKVYHEQVCFDPLVQFALQIQKLLVSNLVEPTLHQETLLEEKRGRKKDKFRERDG
jgi:hypothetical protein